MSVLWFEFTLALRRLGRRRVQNGLMLVTFAVSLALALLSWSLFHTIFLSQPDFDPKGEYLVLNYAGGLVSSGSMHSTGDELRAFQAEQTVFSDFAPVVLYMSLFTTTPHGAERVLASFLSSRALQVTGARPLLGRLFTPDEDKRGSAAKIILSQRMWENSFGSDPNVVGKTINMLGWAVEIVGVMPADFRFPNDQDLWVSFGVTPDQADYPMQDALVKLKPGITRARAERDMQLILDRRGPESTANKRNLKPMLMPLRDFYLLPEIRVSALILFSLALVFVLVSCTNAANLMLIDFLGRKPEIAASLALGVPRSAAIRAVCYQVTVMAAGAAVLALAFLPVTAPWLYGRVKIITAPYWLNYHFEWHYVGMAFALAGVSALATVLAPIFYLLWSDPDRVIRENAYAGRASGRAWWRRLLLTGQIALLTVLGVSAGLLVRSSYHVGETRWGYAAGQVFMGKLSAFGVNAPRDREEQEWLKSHLKSLAEIQARPQTAAAALMENAPGYSNGPYCSYALDPAAFGRSAELGAAFCSRTTDSVFDTFGVPLVAGRMFPHDNPDDGPIYAVINESLARKLWPGQDPLQRALYVRYRSMKETDLPAQLTVCGVVRDYQSNGPIAKTNDCIFTPFKPGAGAGAGIFLLVRDKGGVPDVHSLTEAVHRADPRIPLFFPSTIAGQINMMLSSVRMTTGLTTVFAAAAVLLCAIGVYSLTVAQVLQSSRDFGIRLALGAEQGKLWLHFTRGHLLAALIGVAVGLVSASQVVRVLGSLLYGVDPYNVATYAIVAATILVVAALACIPSLFRLKRINPADCLRSL